MIKLSKTQQAILEAAGNSENGQIIMPSNIRGGAVKKVLQSLTNKELAEQIDDTYIITNIGREAIGLKPKQDKPIKKTRKNTKQSLLIDLLNKPEGATLEQMVEATNWQKHTLRATISAVLKKRLGLEIISEKIPEIGRVYRIENTL
ncbi:MAG: DUF3489 domain-containing protein [Methylococcales bacterium]|jgi:predicted transcriptional regulator|nr:DUF3489 domain-containing protein [Methylococcales bacterium]